MCMRVYSLHVCMYVCIPHACLVHTEAKEGIGPLDLKFWISVEHHVDAGSQTHSSARAAHVLNH